jgi:hypothetical protein
MGNWSDCICGRLAKKFGLSRKSKFTSDVSCPFDYPPSLAPLFLGHKSVASEASDAARAITHFLTFAE